MTRLVVICEGPTEEGFVKSCLAPHLLGHCVYAFPQLLSRRPGARGGGDVSLTSLTAHIRRVHRNFDCVTTLVDYYGFAGKGEMERDELLEAISSRTAEQIGAGFNPKRLIPYVQMHEFEALLFSKPDCFDVEEKWTDSQRREVASIRAGFLSPEDINDHPNTAPSKRLLDVFTKPAFSKTLHGPLIAERIGLEVMREVCPGFGAWLTRLESLGAGS